MDAESYMIKSMSWSQGLPGIKRKWLEGEGAFVTLHVHTTVWPLFVGNKDARLTIKKEQR